MPRRPACHVGFDLPDLRAALRRGDVLVVVDVLSFSTCVAVACSRGVVIVPAGSRRRAAALAADGTTVASVSRTAAPEEGRYSLSPTSFLDAPRGTRVALRSPNGARLAVAARDAPALLLGALVNATAAGEAAAAAARAAQTGVTIIAAGERETGRRRRRFAGEDLLGAGAVAAAVDLPPTGEARTAAGAFEQARNDLPRLLAATLSGRELVDGGFGGDVELAARLDAFPAVPLRSGEEFRGR